MTDTQEQETGNFLAVIEKAAMNPDIDVDKMSKLLDMQERIMNKNAEIAFNRAMADLQPKMPYIPKKAKIMNKNGGVQSFYAKYEEIDRLVRPLYTASGFSVDYNSGGNKYFCTVSHVEGHKKTFEMELPADKTGSKNDIQAMSSTVSYAKRILLCMAFNIVTMDEDDDGESSQDKKWAVKRAKEIKQAFINAKDIKTIDDAWNLQKDDLEKIKESSQPAYDHLNQVYLEYRDKLEGKK